jgi:hypothetical protein
VAERSTEERLGRLETKLDTLADQGEKRFSTLQWLMGLGIAWLTAWISIMVAAGVGLVLKYAVR